TTPVKILQVLDYEVTAGKHGRPRARVEVEFRGQKITAESEGVGPVDAAINALKKATSEHNGLEFRLIDYQVQIDTSGTDSTVEVTMTLQDERENKVVAVGTSPDIILASIEAFEEGYNALSLQR
ncbi:MAG: 2-isopropylmalate synthase, partial [Nitrospinota bacterium]